MSELPNGWETTAIDDIVAPITQRTPDEAEQFTYIDIASIDRETKAISEPQCLLGKDAPSRARKEVQIGDVLVSMTRPNLNAVALVGSELNGAIASTGFDVLRPVEIDSRWLFAHTRSKAFIDAMSALVQGALYPAVKSADVRSFEIPLPPLNEQKRIADKLDRLLARVDAAKARLDKIPPLLKRLRQAILAAATSGGLTEEWRGHEEDERNGIPGSWALRKIGEVGRVQLGRQRSPKFHSGENMRPYLRVQNVYEDRIDLEDVMEMDFPGEDFERYRLHNGDILLNEGQSPEFLGRPAMYRAELEGVCFTNTLIRFQAGEGVKPEFALLVFRHHMHSGRYRAEGNITTNIAHLGAGRFADVEFPLPPIEEQNEIIRLTTELFAIADRIEAQYRAARTRVDRLTQSLLVKAFRGELVPQDPNDEPAAALLERIRAQRAAAPQAKRGRRKKEEVDELPMVAEPKRNYRKGKA